MAIGIDMNRPDQMRDQIISLDRVRKKLEDENKRLKSECKDLKEKYESLEKEFREYVNRPGPSKDYIASGGWRK
jgi:hypothetical protein